LGVAPVHIIQDPRDLANEAEDNRRSDSTQAGDRSTRLTSRTPKGEAAVKAQRLALC
jgi:hypothetical protein